MMLISPPEAPAERTSSCPDRKGLRPVNNSYITTPQEKMSERVLRTCWLTCSGDR